MACSAFCVLLILYYWMMSINDDIEQIGKLKNNKWVKWFTEKIKLTLLSNKRKKLKSE